MESLPISLPPADLLSTIPPSPPTESPIDLSRLSSPEPDPDEQVNGEVNPPHDAASAGSRSNSVPPTKRTGSSTKKARSKSAIQKQLSVQAAASRQRESVLYSNPDITSKIDFDGLAVDMAIHLLDLHWNRLHFTYLLTYRPAIADSLLNNGPYINKLLLSAIYLQSSVHSDLQFHADPDDPQSIGMPFYDRFKKLLPKYIDEPTLPTIVALLICGECLIPYGKQSAGWVYCGMAYRMITDLGYHLDVPPEKYAQLGLTAVDMEIRKRVYWGAYATDKFQSICLGRQPALSLLESTIPSDFLDCHEEWLEWKPYKDPNFPTPGLDNYPGRPAHALSVFQRSLRLATVTERIIKSMYSVNKVPLTASETLHTRNMLKSHLVHWRANIPPHFRFGISDDIPPPPHLLSLYVTHWSLVILIEQPFLNRSQLDPNMNPAAKEEGRKSCVTAALEIWRLLDAYNTAFGFKHAHYGLFYAAYSAVAVMLQHAKQDSPDYVKCLRFFWMMLSEYQRGYARGLEKPLKLPGCLLVRIKGIFDQHANMSESDQTTGGLEINDVRMGIRRFLDLESLESGSFDAWLDSQTGLTFDDAFFAEYSMFGLFGH
ncbi:hypothetical protein FSARC_3952 [Fusarium sarcochroum]|uniref:Xylanolytic transcriptional activator regulatory domain-containing protein n=1 Tax=Fusarium sarcochroum TaxID=1208366 RepID=A0A8H4U2M6_9HYPO|nr:hypothetical protein FSARC_3952 [Fusarium sarcochroum]